MPTSQLPSDQEDHYPGRSGTPTAWVTLAVVVLLLAGWIFFEPLFCGVLRTGLAAACWMRGDRLVIGELSFSEGRRLLARNVDLTFGNPSHRSHWTSEQVELRPASLRGLASRLWKREKREGGRALQWIGELKLGKSGLLVDTRGRSTEDAGAAKTAAPLPSFPWAWALPVSCSGGPVDLVAIGESYRVGIKGMTFQFPDRLPGRFSYGSASLDVGTWHRDFSKAAAGAMWDGASVVLNGLTLAKGLKLEELTLMLRNGRLELGWRGRAGNGRLLGDASFGPAGSTTPLEGIVIAENLPLELLAGVVSDEEKRAAGTIRQGRLTFRGDPDKPLEADGSLRVLADAVRWEGLGWDSLRLAATLTGRTLTLTELTLRQNENELEAEGQSRLPGEWRAVMRAPFTATFRADLVDAASLAALGGPAFAQCSGALSLEGSIKGADNKADGYCNVEGSGMKIRQQPVDWLKGSLFFEGTKTHVGYFEAVNAGDRISLQGTVENSNPHAYEGSAELSLRNLATTLSQLGLSTGAVPGSGAVRGTWRGEGSAKGHQGSFQAKVTDWVGPWTKRGMTGSFEGTYAPDRLELSKAEFFQDDLRLRLQLAATSARLEVKSLSATRPGTADPLLAGNLSLPLNVFQIGNPGGVSGTVGMKDPLDAQLSFRGVRAEDLAELLGQNIPCTGILEGEINASGTPETPEIRSALRVSRFTPDGTGSPARMQVQLDAAQGRATVRLVQDPEASSPLSLRGEIPFRWMLKDGRLQASDPSAPAKGSLAFHRVPVDGWATLLGKGRGLLRGTTLDGALAMQGSLDNPGIAGKILLEAGEANLPGGQHLRNLRLPVDFASGKATVTAGAARLGDTPVALAGTIALPSLEGTLTLTGSDVPFPGVAGVEARGDAALRITAKGTNAPEFGGVLTVRKAASSARYRCTPFFSPPAIPPAVAAPAFPSSTASCWDAAGLNLSVKTAGEVPLQRARKTTAEQTTLGVEFTVKGTVANPQAEGAVTLSDAILELPAAHFAVPRARLQLNAGGEALLEATAFGLTRQGLSAVRLAGTPAQPALLLDGPPGETAASAMQNLVTPSKRDAGTVPLRQEAAWLRQQELFPTPARSWAMARLGANDPASLGFYGAPWSCVLERVPVSTALPKP